MVRDLLPAAAAGGLLLVLVQLREELARRTALRVRALAWALLDQPGQRHYAGELARKLGVPHAGPWVSRTLDQMERYDGWVDGGWEPIVPEVEGRRPRRWYRLTPLGEIQLGELHQGGERR